MSTKHFFCIAIAIVLGCTTKRTTVNTSAPAEQDPRWSQVKAYADKGLYASALSLTDTLLADARTAGQWQGEYRAMMERARYQQMTGVEDSTIIREFETRVTNAEKPLSALLHSVIGERYWTYYSDNRWNIIERTATEATSADVGTWTQPQFMAKVIAEYRASLLDADSLRSIPTSSFVDLLQEPKAELVLRPSLFDVLAHRALAVFHNTETRLAEPASRFKVDDPRFFGLFEDFASLRVDQADSGSWELQALRLHQQLERAHLSTTPPDALVDNTLARLSFIRERSTLSDKDSLYLRALTTLASRLPNDSCLGDVLLAQAYWHQGMAANYQRLADMDGAAAPWKWERKTALSLCDQVIARFPSTHAGRNAPVLRAQLLDSELRVQVEEGRTPSAPFKVAVTYRNVPTAYLRVVKDDRSASDFLEGTGALDDEALLKRSPEREWSVVLPDDGDMNEHLTEALVEGLPAGRYAIVVSNGARFQRHKDNISFAWFWVTRLSAASRTRLDGFDLMVMDRENGAPKSGVSVITWSQTAGYGSGPFVRVGEAATTKDDGYMRTSMNQVNARLAWELIDGKDRFIVRDQWWYGRQQEQANEEMRTFLFTDRAIYRPGQPLLFKGIVTRKKGKTTEVVTAHRTTVELMDVNGEKVASLEVTTDAYGAFNGSFTTPQGGLTGSMTLQEAHGSQNVQVEEYKRPTFEVTFDPIAGEPELGKSVQVTGLAKSYAGVPLDGAKVQWTVKRSAQMPWWCGWYYRGWLPWGRETQVAQGEAVCDAQGKFTVAFLAEGDDQFPRGADPTFNFTVEASATDINGETQSSSTGLSLGYRSIDINIGVGESIDRSTVDSVDVYVANLNGQRVELPMEITVVRLQAPPTPLRDRQWERPDRYTMTREQHAMRFPNETYLNESDPLTWTHGTEVLQARGFVAGGRRLAFDARRWEVGSYLIEASAKDASGRDVKVSKMFTVFDTAIQNTGFVAEAFHVEPVKVRVEPGEKAQLLLSSAAPHCHALMEVERAGRIVVSRWFELDRTQQLVELPALEDDRGGFTVHVLCAERGNVHNQSIFIDVPWTNKELKVEWMSFRDKLLPGSEEEWRLRITGTKGEKVAAQLLGAMYDASLDHFLPHGWDMSIWQSNYAQLSWQRQEPFGVAGGQQVWRERAGVASTVRIHPFLNQFGFEGGRYRYRYANAELRSVQRTSDSRFDEMPNAGGEADVEERTYGLVAAGDVAGNTYSWTTSAKAEAQGSTAAQPPSADVAQPVRSDFRETAFFFPDLLTDRDGSVVLRFKTPDALTRWKVMGLAHTKDLQLAQFTRETVTQKPLMVVPNLPRFLRGGDRITLTAKINVLEKGRAEGLATLELFDPYTNAPITKDFNLDVPAKSFVADQGASASVEWSISVPEGVDVCGVRITARSKGGPQGGIVASDGEERALPVLTDKVLVTESVPLWMSAAGTRTFKLPNLLAAESSSTLRSQSLKLEYTPNPAWFAVQALPYLMEFPHECAEQTFSRYYANALAAYIVEERPLVKKVFEEWKTAGPDAFASKLEKNQELKNVLLAETPWVVAARDDRERKQRIGLLFDMQRMAAEESVALKKLRDMQLGNGAWPWWSGMHESRYITQHLVAGFGHLENLKAVDTRPDGQTQQMLQRAVDWLDADVDREYHDLVKRWKKEDFDRYVPGAYEIHFLYARSFFPRWGIKGGTATAVNFYKERLKATWLQNGLQEQVMAALALDRMGDKATAQAIMRSLKERAVVSEELGMYWKNFVGGWSWESFPTETHALMIEAFHEVAKDEVAVNDLRRYLLKLKQTTDWKTTKATADACYALLLTGSEWLNDAQPPVIEVGGVAVKGDRKEAGTGTIEKSWTAAEVRPAMGEVVIRNATNRPSWGALHWQYFEQMDKVKRPGEPGPFSIRKKVMLTQPGDQGPKLIALDGARALKPGDKLTIRIELRTDRYVDYVHMKDLRAAGLEPTETLSGYKYQGGLGYYQSIRDASTNFFFDRIAPGTYVFEYTLRVTHAGEFSNGITTAMCMYAPEFSGHSEGLRLKVTGQ